MNEPRGAGNGLTALGTALPGESPLRVVLVEDDQADAFLVEELLNETNLGARLTLARTLTEARVVLDEKVHCVLLDLALPDAFGLQALHSVLDTVPDAAVIVLTGYADEHLGIEAVAAGAQDYLVKGQVEGDLLARAIRFAIERKNAEESMRQLREAEQHAAENARLERGLLPQPLLDGSELDCLTRYRADRSRALIGGDFYDVIACSDGRLFALIGDVSGHGPDEAALGVCLRIAWRTLILAGTEVDKIMPTLDAIVVRERQAANIFATVCMLDIEPDRLSARAYLAGHPAPILVDEFGAHQLAGRPHGPILAGLPRSSWPAIGLDLPACWSLLLYTDGLFEGRVGSGDERLGEEGLVNLINEQEPGCPVRKEWPDELIAAVEDLNGGGLADDVALVVLSRQVGP